MVKLLLCVKKMKYTKYKNRKLYTYDGLNRVETEEAYCGDIVAVTGLTGIEIGETYLI